MNKKLKKVIDSLNARKQRLLESKNTFAEADQRAVDEAVAEIDAMLEELRTAEDEHKAEEALSKAADIIAEKLDALQERIDEVEDANKLQPKGKTEYLKSKNSLHDFMSVIRSSNTPREFRRAWQRKLSENGIDVTTNNAEEFFMPDAVKGRIRDAWERNSNWLNALDNVGAKVFYARFNVSDQDTAKTSAHGWPNYPTDEEIAAGKTEQTIEMSGKKIEAQFIYKLISVSNKTIWDDDEALLNYVVDELFVAWRRAVSKAILVGGDATITNVETINRLASDAFVTVDTYDTNITMVENVIAAAESIITGEDTELFLFATKQDINELRKVVLSVGATPQYVPIDDIARSLGVTRVIETNLMDNTTSGAARFILLRPDMYTTTGSLNPEFASQEELRKNQVVYRVEVPFGGGISGLKAAAVLQNA